ncbi:MAG: tetratricopeptide repeat protein [Acidobacteriaceae bacterium]|jgi:tol-pal system protein YbgF|nr:tetratricopeptide repeat protein [Acidobacteriaceae bacterium]
MKLTSRFALLGLLLVPSIFGQKKEILEMQRDLLQMQDQLRSLQRSQDEKLAALQVLLQQTLDAANKANTATAVLEASLRDKLKDQEKNLVVPVAGLGSKIDQMSSDFSSVRESVADLTSRLGKLQNQVADLSQAMRTLSAPPPPPPGATPGAAGPPAGVSAEQLYTAAMRDRTSGNADLAIAQFKDYIQYFGTSDLAPNAQFYIGEIEYLRGDYTAALAAFDKLLEAYPDNAKTADALLLKGRALVKSGYKAEARTEFETLVKKFPSHENAAKAKMDLRALAPVAAPARKKR